MSAAFDPEIRALMCGRCGAPLSVPLAGGQVTCGYCQTTSEIGRARLDPVRLRALAPGPAIDADARERARQTSLRAQASTYNAATNPYAFYDAPPGLEHFDAIANDDPSMLTLLHEAFVEAVRRHEAGAAPLEVQRHLYWIARKIWQLRVLDDQPAEARVYLETARELVTDPGFQQLLRCQMASLARSCGDLAAAERWLASCDPRPAQLDMDSDYRLVASRLAIEREDWAAALDHTGASNDEAPVDPAAVPNMSLHRVIALERLGRRGEAEAELQWISGMAGADFIGAWIERRPYMSACREVWARLDQPGSRSGPSRRRARPTAARLEPPPPGAPEPPSPPAQMLTPSPGRVESDEAEDKWAAKALAWHRERTRKIIEMVVIFGIFPAVMWFAIKRWVFP